MQPEQPPAAGEVVDPVTEVDLDTDPRTVLEAVLVHAAVGAPRADAVVVERPDRRGLHRTGAPGAVRPERRVQRDDTTRARPHRPCLQAAHHAHGLLEVWPLQSTP